MEALHDAAADPRQPSSVPYVQRAVIALTEKGVAFARIDIDLAAKPAWFQAISPLGKVPVLRVREAAMFESWRYPGISGRRPSPSPSTPLTLGARRPPRLDRVRLDRAGRYRRAVPCARRDVFPRKGNTLERKFARLEARLGRGPWFDGERFSLVDAAFGPIFRYFDAFDRIGVLDILDGLPAVARWRAALALRPSVARAVAADYPAQLDRFLASRGSYLGAVSWYGLPPDRTVA